MTFDLSDWYRDFVTWMQNERGRDALEVLSDCSNEYYVNALAAMHLRRYGRARGFERWWARSEWAKVDICFGKAARVFDNWDAAWSSQETGDVGLIEGKVLYWHYGESKQKGILEKLRSQLDDRRQVYTKMGWSWAPLYLGLVWMVSYESHGEAEAERTGRASRAVWADSMTKSALKFCDVPRAQPETAAFDLVASLDLRGTWPLSRAATASLWVTLVELV